MFLKDVTCLLLSLQASDAWLQSAGHFLLLGGATEGRYGLHIFDLFALIPQEGVEDGPIRYSQISYE